MASEVRTSQPRARAARCTSQPVKTVETGSQTPKIANDSKECGMWCASQVGVLEMSRQLRVTSPHQIRQPLPSPPPSTHFPRPYTLSTLHTTLPSYAHHHKPVQTQDSYLRREQRLPITCLLSSSFVALRDAFSLLGSFSSPCSVTSIASPAILLTLGRVTTERV